MKVLLIGEIYSENLGDQLVYFSTKEILKKEFPKIKFGKLDIMGRRDYVSNTVSFENNDVSTSDLIQSVKHNIANTEIGDYLMKKRRAKKNNSYYEKIISNGYDIAVFVGGQVISDTFGTYIFEITKILEKYQIPIIFNAAGLGKLNVKQQVKNYNASLNRQNVESISCRCDVNRFNKTLFNNNNEKTMSTFDLGIFASELYNVERNKDSDLIGLGIMMSKRFKTEILIQFWMNVIRKLNNDNIEWRIFTTGQKSDYLLAIKILKRMNFSRSEINELLITRPTNPDELIKTIANFDKILSFRLHSHIIAYSLNVPSVAIEWDEKISDFMNKINNSERYSPIYESTEKIINNLYSLDRDPNHRENLENNKQISKNILFGAINKIIL